MFTTTTLSLGAAGLVVYASVAFAALHLLDPATDAVGRAGSEYVLGPFGYLMTSVYLTLAAALVLLTAALMRVTGRRGPTAPLLLASGGLVVSSIFPTDRGLVPTSTSGAIHNLAGLLAFLSLVAGSVWVARTLDRAPRSAGRTTTLKLLAAAAVVCFVANFLVAGPFAGSGVFGLAQRATLAALLSWLIATALLIARSERALDPRAVAH